MLLFLYLVSVLNKFQGLCCHTDLKAEESLLHTAKTLSQHAFWKALILYPHPVVTFQTSQMLDISMFLVKSLRFIHRSKWLQLVRKGNHARAGFWGPTAALWKDLSWEVWVAVVGKKTSLSGLRWELPTNVEVYYISSNLRSHQW